MKGWLRVLGDIVILLVWFGPWFFALVSAWRESPGGGKPKEIVIKL